MSNKRCLITGANSSLGKACALQLARMGWEVIMLYRNRERGELAWNDVRRQRENPEIVLMLANLASQTSIRAFAEAFTRRYGSLNGLLNCAGIRVFDRRTPVDGIELMFGSEHLDIFCWPICLSQRSRPVPRRA
jgi:NAD(P)-dependent dehydrogenase (short-subunit alcohol dehydrogenase family)